MAWDQISTIINRLTKLAELTNPLDLANAIEEVIRAVEDPVPGDPAELRTLAGAFILAGRDIKPIGGDLHTLAERTLPDVWHGDLAESASTVINDTGDLVDEVQPAFRSVAQAIDAYADTLQPLERARQALVQQLHDASGNGPDADVFGIRIPLDPLAWAPWIESVRNLIFGSIHLYNDVQNAGDILTIAFADAEGRANAVGAVEAGMNPVDAVVLADTILGGDPSLDPSFIGSQLFSPAQLAALAEIMKGLSPADRTELDSVLAGMSSPLEKAFVLKALAAGNSLSAVVGFVGEIRGKDDMWLVDHLSLAGMLGDFSVVQTTTSECGSMSIVAARAMADPMFAYGLTTGPGGSGVSLDQFKQRLAAVTQQVHDETNSVWPQSLGTSPWGMASGMSALAPNAGYHVQWVDDTDPRSSYTSLEQAVGQVDAGHPVAVLLAPTLGGLAHDTALHYVLITRHVGDTLYIYQPGTGMVTVPQSDFLRGTMTNADGGAPHVNAVIMPSG